MNPFPYSSDNKRYHTYSWHLKQKYGRKIAKIPLDAGFTCPNRDGSKGWGGCAFCSARGSGDTILAKGEDVRLQFELGLERARQKWPNCGGIAYFQAYTNTYAPLEKLKELYGPVYDWPDAVEISIATRPDCLTEDMMDWFASQSKETWFELGLQDADDGLMASFNRKHSSQELEECVQKLHARKLPVCLHIINGLPGQTREQMMATIEFAAKLKPEAVKIHMFHLLENTALAKQKENIHFLTMEEYVSIVCDQLERLPQETIIERVSGDGLQEDLIGPGWTIKKTQVANEIDKQLKARNSWQGKKPVI